MSVWDELIGSRDVVDGLRALASAPDREGQLPHAWLVTGPAGSGRSNLARAFAQSLLCERHTGCGECAACTLVAAGTHPDLTVLATDKVIIPIEDVRDLVNKAQLSPAMGHYRIQLIEDADRMAERTSNVLLKSLEEPPERTIWLLCAPSANDLLPTIRSRVRVVRLVTPAPEEVAALIRRRDGVDAETALACAREAQSHVGMARRLATSGEARQRRHALLRAGLSVLSVGDAVFTAARIVDLAKEDTLEATERRFEDEERKLRHQLGLGPSEPIPPAQRSLLRKLQEDQKRRATRALRDGVDRALLDLTTLYRDVLLVALDADAALINLALEPEIRACAQRVSADELLGWIDQVQVARQRIAGNVPPVLALEGLFAACVGGSR